MAMKNNTEIEILYSVCKQELDEVEQKFANHEIGLDRYLYDRSYYAGRVQILEYILGI